MSLMWQVHAADPWHSLITNVCGLQVLQRSESSVEEEDEFMEEARTMMGLRHDNVVRLVGVRCTARPMFIGETNPTD